MDLWFEHIDSFRERIWYKVVNPTDKEEREMEDGKVDEMEELMLPLESFRIFGYLDTSHVKACRPGSGPVEDGRRRENAHNIQRAFCSTYLKAHGLKFQSVCLPNGMWGNAWGCSMRHNNLGV